MATLDMSIVFVVLVVSLILTLLGYGMKQWLFNFFSAVYGIFMIAYIFQNYQLVAIGSFTIAIYPVFVLALFFLCVLVPLVLMFGEF
jgi:hypothetical protein